MNRAEAVAKAKALKALMATKGWRINVWNNLGWCFSIQSKWMSIHQMSNGKYTCFMNDSGDYRVGDAVGFWNGLMGDATENHADPNVAVARRIASAQSHADKLNSKLESVRESIGLGRRTL